MIQSFSTAQTVQLTKDIPKISIITPSFNQGAFIEETIQSVISQSYPNIEYIIIDGKSTDNTMELLKKYENRLFWISEPDTGQTNAINKGVRLAKGEIIAYINSDDLYLPCTLEKVVHFFQENPEVAALYGNIIHIDKDSNELERYKPGKLNPKRILLENFYLPQPTLFFKRKVLEKIGFFDESMDVAMDFDYWVRISQFFQLGYLDDFLASARLYPETKSASRQLKYFDESMRILEKYLQQNPEASSHFKHKARSLVYINGARSRIGAGLFKDAKQFYISAYRLFPPHIFKIKDIFGFLLCFTGKNGKKIIECLKKNWLLSALILKINAIG